MIQNSPVNNQQAPVQQSSGGGKTVKLLIGCFVALVLLSLCGVGGYFAYDYYQNNMQDDSEESEEQSEENEEKKDNDERPEICEEDYLDGLSDDEITPDLLNQIAEECAEYIKEDMGMNVFET